MHELYLNPDSNKSIFKMLWNNKVNLVHTESIFNDIKEIVLNW